MRYVISDIHGELEKLKALLSLVDKASAEFIFLGDYIDKGIDSKGVVDFLIELKNSNKCIFLMGDHEYAWLRYFRGEERFLDFILKYGGDKTLESYLGRKFSYRETRGMLSDKKKAKGIFGAHLDFYSDLKYYYQDEDFLYVHAGLNPAYRGKDLAEHDKENMVFIRDKFLHSEFLYKGRKIVFGHTAFKEPYVDRFKIGIDTGAVYRDKGLGNLTAFSVERGEFMTHEGMVRDLLRLNTKVMSNRI